MEKPDITVEEAAARMGESEDEVRRKLDLVRALEKRVPKPPPYITMPTPSIKFGNTGFSKKLRKRLAARR